jgi:hypothetical protein
MIHSGITMKRNLATSSMLVLFTALIVARAVPAIAQTSIEQFFDSEYKYSFQYPSGWPIRKLPEGDAHKEVRARLQGPNGSSFTVIVEPRDKKITKEEFRENPQPKDVVEAMMAETIEQIYKTISKNVKATSMNVGDRRDLSNEWAVKFYISTLHTLANKRSIIVAGIHAFPFSEDYGINFLMSAFTDKTAKAEIGALTSVFNSFRLSTEPGGTESHPGPAAKAPEPAEPKQ